MHISTIAKFMAHKSIDLYEGCYTYSLEACNRLGIYRLMGKVLSKSPGLQGKDRELEALMYAHAQQVQKVAFDALHQLIETPDESTFETLEKRLMYVRLAGLGKLADLAA